jgi:hypothetical protein
MIRVWRREKKKEGEKRERRREKKSNQSMNQKIEIRKSFMAKMVGRD